MVDRPILRNRPPAPAAPAPVVSTGGRCLDDLIVAIDILRLSLGYPNWAALSPLCNEDPRTTDEAGLVELGQVLQTELESRIG